MSIEWYHFWCEVCGRNEYIGVEQSEGGLATTYMCVCGESSVGGRYHEDYLGIGTIKFEKEGEE